MSMSGCRVAPRGDDIMLNIDDTTKVVTVVVFVIICIVTLILRSSEEFIR